MLLSWSLKPLFGVKFLQSDTAGVYCEATVKQLEVRLLA